MPYFGLRVPNQLRQDWLADNMLRLDDGLSSLVGLGRVGNLTVLEALWISFGNSAFGLFATFQESDAATWTWLELYESL